MSIRKFLALLLSVFHFNLASAAPIDQQYGALDALLHKHVRWLPDNVQSRVDYAGLKAENAALKKVLTELSSLTQNEFDQWTAPQQMAYLINAYNAFTLELILSKYPDIKSIKDLGSLFQSPWKQKFFKLLGSERSLDWIENDMLRLRYKDPRIHVGINCASIGCPALRPESYTAAKLDTQLDDGMLRFLGDRTRNRVRDGKLEVSSIFKWFGEDFEMGNKGYSSVSDVFARYATQLSDDPVTRNALRNKTLAIVYLNYDWTLNDKGR